MGDNKPEDSKDLIEASSGDNEKPKEKSLKSKNLKKGPRKSKSDTKTTFDHSTDLKVLAQSLAAVKEDPSLIVGMDEDDIILPKKKPGNSTGTGKRGRPPKIRSITDDDPPIVSRKIKTKKKSNKKIGLKHKERILKKKQKQKESEQKPQAE